MSIKDEIKRKVEYILKVEDDEASLDKLNEELASYEKKLEKSAWGRTPENVKLEVRNAFESMKDENNTVNQEEMAAHLNSWRERLDIQK